MPLERIELKPHRGRQILPALATRGRPHPLQDLERLSGVLRSPRLPRPNSDIPTTPGGSFAARTRRRRALSRDQPVTATTSSSTRPLSFFDATAYAFANLLVTSARDPIDNSLPIPRTLTVSRAFLREAPTAFRGHFY